MRSDVRKIKPGILVSLKTHQSGNRSYQKRELEHPHITEGGVQRSRWDTTKIVFDPDEAKEAGQVANRARYLITRLCADTAHGPLCPVERRDELVEAIAEARELTENFNMKATFTRVEVNVICGEIVADDLEAARALFSETEKFLNQMQEGLRELDVKKVRAICVKALDVGQMLSPEAGANIAVAVNAARAQCKKIVAAGEQVAIQIDQRTIDTIGLARNSFLDFGMDNNVDIEPAYTPRALDFDAEPELCNDCGLADGQCLCNYEAANS